MADYEPLIARAVAGLEYNTGENRRVLYERARTALVSQLRGVDPPLEEGDITRERLALEEAIRKVEAEAAAKEQATAPAGEAEPRVESAPMEAPPEKQRSSLGDRGLRSFRESMAEAEGLGRASAEANRAARESFGTVSGERAAEEPEETHYFEGRRPGRNAAAAVRRAGGGHLCAADAVLQLADLQSADRCARRLAGGRERRRCRLLATRHHLLDVREPADQQARPCAGPRAGADRAGGQGPGAAQDR
jgi:hypothetical protein